MSEPIDPAFLRDSELFENQPAEVIRAVLEQGQLVEFGPGEVVFRQGDEGDRLFVVKRGVLEVVATPPIGENATTTSRSVRAGTDRVKSDEHCLESSMVLRNGGHVRFQAAPHAQDVIL